MNLDTFDIDFFKDEFDEIKNKSLVSLVILMFYRQKKICKS